MTETQMTLIAQWLIIGSIWVVLGLYTAAVFSRIAYDQRMERQKIMPTRPAKLLVTMVSMDAIGHRPWWKAPESYAIPMYKRIREQAGLLQ